MLTTIIAVCLSWFISSKFKSNRYIIFGILALLLMVPVRYVVYPVSEFVSQISMDQLLKDTGFMFQSAFTNAWNIARTGEGKIHHAIPAYLCAMSGMLVSFKGIKNVSGKNS